MSTEQPPQQRPRRVWNVTPFAPSDLPAIGLYFKKHLSAVSQYGSMALFHWRAVGNYLMPGIINLIKDGDKIVATLSNTPKKLLVRGEECIVAEIGDANTDPDYQRQGMLALLIDQSTQDALNRGMHGVYSTPSTETPSLPAFVNKANFKPQKDVRIRNLVFPLDIGPLVARRTHWLVGRYVSAAYETGVWGYSLLKSLTNRGTSSTVEQVERLPDDWDVFWEKARQPYDVIFDRSRAALTWRFFDHPNRYKFYVVRQSATVVGYVVSRMMTDQDARRMVVADFLFLPGHERDFLAAIRVIFRDAMQSGANAISAWCLEGSSYDADLRTLGFLKRMDMVLVWFQNDFVSRLTPGARWHFTVSDSDNV